MIHITIIKEGNVVAEWYLNKHEKPIKSVIINYDRSAAPPYAYHDKLFGHNIAIHESWPSKATGDNRKEIMRLLGKYQMAGITSDPFAEDEEEPAPTGAHEERPVPRPRYPVEHEPPPPPADMDANQILEWLNQEIPPDFGVEGVHIEEPNPQTFYYQLGAWSTMATPTEIQVDETVPSPGEDT